MHRLESRRRHHSAKTHPGLRALSLEQWQQRHHVTWAAPSIATARTVHPPGSTCAPAPPAPAPGQWWQASPALYTLSGLAAGVAIDVQLQAANAAGTSAWSTTSTLTTASTGAYAPNAPAIPGVAPPADGTNSRTHRYLDSLRSRRHTHGAATGYNLRSSPSGLGTWTTVSGVTSPYTLTGLAGATAIDVEVQATNAAASPGAWSAITTCTTWGCTVVWGSWQAATSQVHNAPVAPNTGVNMTAVAAPTTVTEQAFAWSTQAMPRCRRRV